MNNKRFHQVVERMISKCQDTLLKKGTDYSSDTDRLSNFKEAAKRKGITPYQVLGVYMDKHVTAVDNFISRGKLESEPIEDRLMDIINYCMLLVALIEDNDQALADDNWSRIPPISNIRPSVTISDSKIIGINTDLLKGKTENLDIGSPDMSPSKKDAHIDKPSLYPPVNTGTSGLHPSEYTTA